MAPVRTRCAPFYTEVVFDMRTMPKIVDWIVLTCRGRYSALAACGHSGLVPASAAAYILGVPLIAVRKANEHAKGDMRVVNAVLRGRVNHAFVDDLIGSGGTLMHVTEAITKSDIGHLATIAGILLYNSGDSYALNALPGAVAWGMLPLHVRPT